MSILPLVLSECLFYLWYRLNVYFTYGIARMSILPLVQPECLFYFWYSLNVYF